MRQDVAEASYLDKLNDGQRAAAEFGTGEGISPPLLIIAGVGSGKTATLAHRVAHLLVNGAEQVNPADAAGGVWVTGMKRSPRRGGPAGASWRV